MQTQQDQCELVKIGCAQEYSEQILVMFSMYVSLYFLSIDCRAEEEGKVLAMVAQ